MASSVVLHWLLIGTYTLTHSPTMCNSIKTQKINSENLSFKHKPHILDDQTNCSNSGDVGFELFFQTNHKEFRDEPLYFEKQLPMWLRGSLMKNGLGQFEMGNRNLTHGFDGYAKLTLISMNGTKQALFSAKFLGTAFWNQSTEKEDIAPYLLFTSPEPNFNFADQALQFLNGLDNANINCMDFNGAIVALSDMWRVYHIDSHSLKAQQVNPKGPFLWPWEINVMPNALSSSHPVPEKGTQNYFNFYIYINPLMDSSTVHVCRIHSASKRTFITKFDLKFIPYMHSLSATEHYIILHVHPAKVNSIKLLKTKSPAKSLDWDENEPTQLHVIEILTGDIKIFKTNPRFANHAINAFEDKNQIIADFVSYPNPDFFDQFLLKTFRVPYLRDSIPVNNSITRYIIDFPSGIVSQKLLPRSESIANGLDLPTINEAYRYKRYCYVYGITVKADSQTFGDIRLSKKDLCDRSGQGDIVWSQKNHYPSEPWFVASPNSSREDDGMLLVVILNGISKRSYLAVFDARSLTMINKSTLPTYVPFMFHGRFFENLTI